MLLFIFALLTLCVAAATAAAALQLRSFVSFLLATYLFASAGIVLCTEVLSLVRRADRWGYLVAELILLGAAGVAWNARGRPRPPPPSRIGRAALVGHPVLAGLAFVVVAAVLYEAFVILGTPPNNGDSMSGGLVQAVEWFQHRGVFWIPDAYSPRQNEWLPIAQMEILYTFAFLERDLLAALPQFVAQAAIVLAVYGTATRLRFGRAAAAFAALVTATLPQVALQSVTTQSDLLVASFVVAAAFFLLSGGRTDLALAGLAVGLALGTKATALLAVPALALLAVVTLRGRALAVAAAWAAAGFALVGAYGYVQNLVQTGSPLGTGKAQSDFRPEVTVRGTISSGAKVAYRFVDFTGYHLRPAWRQPIADSGEAAFDALRVPVAPPESSGFPFSFDVNITSEEDKSWYGPLGFLLLVPVAVAFAFPWRGRRADPARTALAWALPIYALGLVLVYREGPWFGRYLLTAVVLVLPLVASVYRYRKVSAAIAVLGTLTLVLAHAYNAGKPTGLEGGKPVWELSRAEAQAVPIPGFAAVIERIDTQVPPDASLGVVFGEHDWGFPFYGERLSRRLVPLSRHDALREAERRGLRVVLFGRSVDAVRAGPRWEVTRFESGATLLIRRTH